MRVQMRVQDVRGARMPTADESGSTVRRMVLGGILRRLREEHHVTPQDAARVIGGSASKISRLETGKASVKVSDVTALLDRYGVLAGPERDEWLEMARYANVPGWWHTYSDVIPGWFQTYVGLEAAAKQIRSYESQFIPGLLQTEAYSRAITSTGRSGRTVKQVDRRVKSRLERQRILATSKTVLWTVIDEAALHRPIGGREVMRKQLEHLLHLIEKSSVITIQVLPFAIDSLPAEFGAFSILRFVQPGRKIDPEPDPPEIVYLEHLTGALYLDKVDEVEQYKKAFVRLTTAAQQPIESAETITKIIATL
jgi:transcriptional regulator with XRE-family HTH domain